MYTNTNAKQHKSANMHKQEVWWPSGARLLAGGSSGLLILSFGRSGLFFARMFFRNSFQKLLQNLFSRKLSSEILLLNCFFRNFVVLRPADLLLFLHEYVAVQNLYEHSWYLLLFLLSSPISLLCKWKLRFVL